ncbi:hypothetical protein [Clostridium felsineum]|uniref:hypothetical protein n=1 Tax=Clostridium felsineum TaxID=36839 RepID=UPI0009CF8578|nr:hypothetical protein [Clostridium felsineum]URZ15313.1 hypothetical protein CLFE_013310 [Clostridium felsineum DSM 794]
MQIMIMRYSKYCWYSGIDYIGKKYKVISQTQYYYVIRNGKEIRDIKKCDAVVI